MIVNADGTPASVGVVSKNNTTISLKDGQTATVYSLPPGTTYKVVETKTAGFTVSPSELAGTIVAGATQYAAFTNTYTVTPVTSDAIVGKKVLAGRTWQNGDSFTFCINNYNNAPLPINYDPAKGVVVTAADADANGEAAFNLGKIEFTAPGVYRYTIYEEEPAENEILPGFTYSRALYRLVVTVEDNGTGSLVIKSTDLQQLYTDGAEPLFTYNNAGEIVMNSGEEAEDEVVFTNTYSANSVVRVPVALKDYVDKSGALPLTSGMFKFEMKAIGYILGSDPNKLVETSDIPMPAGAANGVITTTNEGRNITFPSIEFTQNSIPNGEEYVIFRYRMKELVPTDKLYGMNYDETEYFVDVKVSIDHTKDELDVVATYQAGVVYPTFRNEYTPDPATVYINGTKTLLGRDMKAGESFEFVLAGANAVTNNAVRNGEVIVPSTVAYASNGTDGKATAFAFGGIQFNKVGTYVFSVSETAGNAPSVKYDDTVVTVTVVIADDNKDGKLEASSVTYSNGKSAAEFTNTYTAEFDGTPVTLEGYKTLFGKTLLEGEFFFNVVEYYNGTKISEGLVSHEKDTVADANGAYTGAIKFIENKTYDKIGTYVYYINEQIPTPAVGGTTYSDSEYRYTVVVQDVDKVGKITVTSKYLEVKTANGWTMANAVEFVNEYTPAPATAVLPIINKVIAGDRSEPLKAGEFSFEIKSVSQNPAGGMTLPSTTVVSNDADGKIVFGDIVFTKPGFYTVVVSEVIPDDADKVAGITYSTQKITATYEVVDDRNGKLTAVLVNYAGGEEIINRYEAKAADVEITIEKDLQGRNWEANDSFEFEVVILDPSTIAAVESGAIEFPMDVSGSGIAIKVIDTEGETITGNVKIHVAGTYKFIVREITGTIPGIHYDSQPREIVIVATDDSVNAEIDVTIDGVATTKKTITFVNVYDAESTELSGHDHLTIVKEFTGRSGNEWLDSDKFEFVLEAADKATKDAIDAGKVVLPSSTTLTVSNANKAHPHFGNIVFNAEGTYKFKVTEIEGSIPGVKYDTTSRVITVKVSDNNAGQLVAELQAGSDSLEFNNSYTPKEVVLVGSASLEIIKALTGRDWKNTDEFTFVIAPYGEITAGAIANGDVVMPSSNKLVITDESTAVDGGKKGRFGDITFKKAGSYRFVISEEEGNIDNVDYDRNTYHAIVVVTDNDAGQLVTSVNYVGSKVFVNEYTPDNAEVSISGTKELGGDDRELKADEFEFVISAVTPGAPMPSKLTVTNDAQGKIDFGTIIYIAEGVYEYKITETKGSLAGITYDDDAVMVKVTVTYNAASGEFETDVKYTKGNEQPSANFRFRNIYTLKASEPLDIEIEKVVNPSEGNIFNFKGDEFSFVITGKNNAPMPVASKVTNDRNGKAKFEDIVFDKAGVYEYTVVEESGTRGGITYDSSVYNVTVTVTENKTTAQLETSLKITDSQGKDAEIVFNNKYDPKSTSVIIFGSKVLNSEHKTLEANKFSFKLEALSPTCPLPKETVVKNVDAGTFRFDTIEFTKIGEYKYRITEVDLGENGYTYDKREFIVTVVVTDEGNGELKAEVTGLGTTQYPTIKFINEYVPAALKVDLFAEKVLNGRELKEGEFVFELKDADGKTVLISSNLEDGSVTFKDLEFTKAGEYKFTVSETKGSVNGIIYDNTVYNLVVIIKDEDGQLEIADATATKAGTNEEVDELIFTNTYDPTKNPQTGNSLNLPMWMAIMLISGGAALTLCIAEKKRRSSKA